MPLTMAKVWSAPGPMSASDFRSDGRSGSTPSFLSSTAARSAVRWMIRAFAAMSCGWMECRGG